MSKVKDLKLSYEQENRLYKWYPEYRLICNRVHGFTCMAMFSVVTALMGLGFIVTNNDFRIGSIEFGVIITYIGIVMIYITFCIISKSFRCIFTTVAYILLITVSLFISNTNMIGILLMLLSVSDLVSYVVMRIQQVRKEHEFENKVYEDPVLYHMDIACRN